jgi:hypothetical protein
MQKPQLQNGSLFSEPKQQKQPKSRAIKRTFDVKNTQTRGYGKSLFFRRVETFELAAPSTTTNEMSVAGGGGVG